MAGYRECSTKFRVFRRRYARSTTRWTLYTVGRSLQIGRSAKKGEEDSGTGGENYFDLQKTGSVIPSAPMRAHLLCSLLALPAAAALLVAPTAARLPRVAASRAAGPAMIFGDIMKGVAKLQAGSYDEAAVKAALERQIQNRPCVMYSFSTCPFCKQTKEVLDRMGAMYTCVELDEVEGGMATRAELANKVGRTSMPAVFAGGEYIGGANDGGMGGVLTLNKAGSLKPLLQKAGSIAADRV